jgi:hypothetical protein
MTNVIKALISLSSRGENYMDVASYIYKSISFRIDNIMHNIKKLYNHKAYNTLFIQREIGYNTFYDNFESLPENLKTYFICKMAVVRDYDCIKCVPDKHIDMDMIYHACIIETKWLNKLKNKTITQQFCDNVAINCKKINILDFPEEFRSDAVLRRAVSTNIENYPYIPNSMKTIELTIMYIKCSRQPKLNIIPEHFITIDIIIDSVRKFPLNFDHIPPECMSIGLVQRCIPYIQNISIIHPKYINNDIRVKYILFREQARNETNVISDRMWTLSDFKLFEIDWKDAYDMIKFIIKVTTYVITKEDILSFDEKYREDILCLIVTHRPLMILSIPHDMISEYVWYCATHEGHFRIVPRRFHTIDLCENALAVKASNALYMDKDIWHNDKLALRLALENCDIFQWLKITNDLACSIMVSSGMHKNITTLSPLVYDAYRQCHTLKIVI